MSFAISGAVGSGRIDGITKIVRQQESWAPLYSAAVITESSQAWCLVPIHTLKVKTTQRTQLVDVTAQVQQAVAKSRVVSGVCYVYVPHTTAAIMINECADPDVASDLEGAFDRLIPSARTLPARRREFRFAYEIRTGWREPNNFCGRRQAAVGALAGNLLLRI